MKNFAASQSHLQKIFCTFRNKMSRGKKKYTSLIISCSNLTLSFLEKKKKSNSFRQDWHFNFDFFYYFFEGTWWKALSRFWIISVYIALFHLIRYKYYSLPHRRRRVSERETFSCQLVWDSVPQGNPIARRSTYIYLSTSIPLPTTIYKLEKSTYDDESPFRKSNWQKMVWIKFHFGKCEGRKDRDRGKKIK